MVVVGQMGQVYAEPGAARADVALLVCGEPPAILVIEPPEHVRPGARAGHDGPELVVGELEGLAAFVDLRCEGALACS